jgi:hypothetical protein
MTKTFSLILILSLSFSLGLAQREKFGSGIAAVDSFRRASNNTAYAAGDLFATATPRWLIFLNIGRYAGTAAFATHMVHATFDTLNTANLTPQLWLFDDTTGITLPADNAAINLPTAALDALVDRIPMTGTYTIGAIKAVFVSGSSQRIWVWRADRKHLFGFIEMGGAYVPKYAGNTKVKLIVGGRY